jgi:hypothetical protein
MTAACRVLLCLLSALAAVAPGFGQEPRPATAGPVAPCAATPAYGSTGDGSKGLHWTDCCFPRRGCCDDYCPHPYPRQCWPPYPPFYKCVPAGHCAHPPCVGVGDEKLAWWFLPTPRALREALWCQP